MALDPQIEWVLGLVEKAAYPPLESLDPLSARRQFEETVTKLDCEPAGMAAVEDRAVPGPAGDIAVRLYVPHGAAGSGNGPGLVFYHGGGWVIGSLRSHDRVCRALADKSGRRVVSVGYRMAPEHRFPAAVEDAVAAYHALREGAASFGLDPRRLAVGGDSAGGNLAAVVAQDARDRGTPPGFQVLVYPATDMRGGYESLRANGDGYLLTQRLMDWFYGHYFEGAGDEEDPRASPILGDLTGLPPALIVTAGYDPLRDEGRAYAEALQAAGVAARLSEYPGMIHGFFQMSGAIDEAKRAVDEVAAVLRKAFGSWDVSS